MLPLNLASTLFDQEFESQLQAKVNTLFATDVFKDFSWNDESVELISQLFRCSEFAAENCLRYPEYVVALLRNNLLFRDYDAGEYQQRLQTLVPDEEDDASFAQVLREFRNQEMLRLAWRDLVCQVDVTTTLRELSWLADACIEITLHALEQWQSEKLGTPVDSNGKPMKLVVLAMGKLGAHELNFSSDIDLVFVYSEDGVITNGSSELSHSQYFVRLCQRFVRLLSDVSAYGFVFRVDTRLRPFGNSGQLASSFDALELYYERHGREWERYAMIKARAISSDASAASELMQLLKPFVYRRYLDYGAFASLREMKVLIDKEVSRTGADRNIKLGPGGIREIEFIGQAFQLIRGGRTPRLQIRPILSVLDTLQELKLIPVYVVASLKDAYLFLRKVENTIQAYADKQTHLVPSDALEQKRLAYALGYLSWAEFNQTLRDTMQTVHEHFEQIFSAPQLDVVSGENNGIQDSFGNLWLGIVESEEATKQLKQAGYESGEKVYQWLKGLREGSVYRTLGKNGKQRLDKLMPLLLGAAAKASNPDECLIRVLRLIESIAKRTAYLSLLSEYPLGLSQLVRLFDASPWIVDLVVSHPMLLDELLDPRRLYEPMSKEALQAELKSQLDFDCEDVEQQMYRLIEFKQSNVLRVAAAELTGAMPVEKVSDHLTYIAEIVLEAVCHFARVHLQRRHGKPQYVVDEQVHDAEFCVIAYGKLGGYELGFGSDLDLVFLHDSQGKQQVTDGEKSIDNAVFFARLGQRIIHFLNTPTQAGVLYEVDARLRPSGSAGMLVSSLKSFSDYQEAKAWTWEHQALIRARLIVGDASIGEQFQAIRIAILTKIRDAENLCKEVREMRVRMRNELLKAQADQFDLKQGVGGITDIEFITQYLVLKWADKYPALVKYTDNLRLIETLVHSSVLAEDDAKILTSAYLAYRHAAHKLVLQGKSLVNIDDAAFIDYREGVTRIWNDIME